jgi:hypothetical protein
LLKRKQGESITKNISGSSTGLLLAALALSGCGMVGDTSSVRDANELAIECRTDEALAAVEQAEQGGGLSSYIADLQKVVILRDAGRMAEADAAMAARNKRAEATTEEAAEAEEAAQESLADLRAEREKKTGSATCP